jgi:chaperone required for assembly of F1-ATPase
MFKDALLLPSRALAVALAEEWEAQQDVLDVKKLHLNSMVSKGVRSMHDL